MTVKKLKKNLEPRSVEVKFYVSGLGNFGNSQRRSENGNLWILNRIAIGRPAVFRKPEF
jgi:hypothetical protein